MHLLIRLAALAILVHGLRLEAATADATPLP